MSMLSNMHLRRAILGTALLALLVGGAAYASHSWGLYHWARTANPFTLKLGDNVTSAWDSYLGTASADWSLSNVLDTNVVAGGTTAKRCRPTNGRVEVCNAKYGNNGWLGIAQIWITGGEHITQGVVKLNDTYFSQSGYNTPAWRRMVMCQEIGHTFGLDHQDETFNNANLGTCMDYTNDPDGGPGGAAADDSSNEHPNAHDYEQLETIYAHTDSTTTIASALANARARLAAVRASLATLDVNAQVPESLEAVEEWGKILRHDRQNRPALYERDFGRGEKVFTFVLWADGRDHEE